MLLELVFRIKLAKIAKGRDLLSLLERFIEPLGDALIQVAFFGISKLEQ